MVSTTSLTILDKNIELLTSGQHESIDSEFLMLVGKYGLKTVEIAARCVRFDDTYPIDELRGIESDFTVYSVEFALEELTEYLKSV